jgi:hypothetical protein
VRQPVELELEVVQAALILVVLVLLVPPEHAVLA